MKKHYLAKNVRKVRRKIDASIGIIGILLIAGIMFAILMFNINVAIAENDVATSDSSVPTKDSQTLNANAAQTQINSIMGMLTPKQKVALRKLSAKNLKTDIGTQTFIQPDIFTGDDGVMIPDYFGPYPNFANSPLPTFNITGVTVLTNGIGYSVNTTVTIAGGDGSGASATYTTDNNGNITSINLIPPYVSGYTYIPAVTITDPDGTGTGASAEVTYTVEGGIRKFIDSLPGLGEANKNSLGQYIPVAEKDISTFPGSEYYEIALVEFREKMHPDLPDSGATLRGYVQISTANVPGKAIPLFYLDGTPILNASGGQVHAVDNPHYMGPTIIAQKDLPVRIKFNNYLPNGKEGDLFLPVDPSIMGAGPGPNNTDIVNTADVICKQNPSVCYRENRATIHLHGGRTPWISDGTVHQWTTPAGETTQYPKGVTVGYVPDMWFLNGDVIPGVSALPPLTGATNNPGDGSLTFYYTNHQSARLMFYHDHAYGITRLNVYAGEAAPYLVRDTVEQNLIDTGIIPTDEIPLVIQDKTFVPYNTTNYSNILGTFPSQLAAQDPTWNTTKWGDTGQLWYPHVYMVMENPSDPTGMAPMGRWVYSPWFWPPFTPEHGPVPNPYYDPATRPWEPPIMPGTPGVSIVAEAFVDTPIVNGAAYPVLTVDPKAYRFRILNGADDRFWNLQLYKAATNDPLVWNPDGTLSNPLAGEVRMVPAVDPSACNEGASPWPAYWPVDNRPGGVPDPATVGPSFIQIGNEGGFLPKPVVLQNKPVNWNMDPGTFDFGIVNQATLYLAPAERADVIVDFSGFEGQTLILYNDAPAPVPANDPRLDYYTGDPDQSDTGGAPSTLPGYGPNTRTIMLIKVNDTTPESPFDLATLENAFKSTGNISDGTFVPGAFAASQDHKIIVPQAYYDSAYNESFPAARVGIADVFLNFTPINQSNPITLYFKNKAIHDEMGGAFDREYGRMSVQFGVDSPFSSALTANTYLYNYADPPTEVIKSSINMAPIGDPLADGTQIWKITSKGVDTHPVHWHMFEVQLINRVAWDNNIREPDPNELGWKETLKVNPLQDTIVALRPIVPDLPFDIPNSIHLLDVTKPNGAVLKVGPGLIADPNGQPINLYNHVVNFGWEYLMHCHILAHEENDMMRPIIVGVTPDPVSDFRRIGKTRTLTWIDNSTDEINFIVQRSLTGVDPWTTISVIPSGTGPAKGTASYNYLTKGTINQYYRVMAQNVVGDTTVFPPATTASFPTLSLNSTPSNVVQI
jgi:FtsP/CotA-like multicopper oxidase with cupredoxin domain